jgi:hypothetical protein
MMVAMPLLYRTIDQHPKQQYSIKLIKKYIKEDYELFDL